MLNKNITSNFLGIRNVSINKIREKNKFIKIYLSTAKSIQVCPCCKSVVHRVSTTTVIKHSSYRGEQVLLPTVSKSLKTSENVFFYASVTDNFNGTENIIFVKFYNSHPNG